MPEGQTQTRRGDEGYQCTMDGRTSQRSQPASHQSSQFFLDLVALRCRYFRAREGAVFGANRTGGYTLLASHSLSGGTRESNQWLACCAAAAEKALSTRAVVLAPATAILRRILWQGLCDWLRPGMEGVAKVAAEERSYAWIWTRKVATWIR